MPLRLSTPTHAGLVVRIALLALALPCVYFGGAGAAYFYRSRSAGQSMEQIALPLTAAPTSSTRLLVVAPHCDDEALGCAGRIIQTRAADGAVEAVIITNGDGFRTAVERQARNVRVGPEDYIRFASARQQESYGALKTAGLRDSDVLFLGYPDQGLSALWNTNWDEAHPFTSGFTRVDYSPYSATYDSHAKYCGADLLSDLKRAMRRFHPNVVVVTHPADDHPDHTASASFVTLAVRQLQSDAAEAPWARKMRLEYYLVHRGDWPLPQGSHIDRPLQPPAAMMRSDTHWSSLSMTARETDRKRACIDRYVSQQALMPAFLAAFSRRSEIYGTLPAETLARISRAAAPEGGAPDWQRLTPVLLDPVRDNLMRDLQGGGDIRALYLCHGNGSLYARLVTRQPVSPRFAYLLRFRTFGMHGQTARTTQDIIVQSGLRAAAGVHISVRDCTLDVQVPWTEIAASKSDGRPVRLLAVSVETTLGGVSVDRTGTRFLRVD